MTLERRKPSEVTWDEMAETEYGFQWGQMIVTRVTSDPRFGGVLRIETPAGKMTEIRVSAKGTKIEITKCDCAGCNEGKCERCESHG